MSTVREIDSSEKPPPLVSIIIPVFNGIPYIIHTIESVRRQTYTHWELLICDNMSDDKTVACVQKSLDEKPDPRIRLITHRDLLPMTQNWNRSLTYAGGDFIKLLPADDLLLPHCIEVQQRILQEHPNVGFVACGKEVIDSKGRRLFCRKPLKQGEYNWQNLGRRTLMAVTNLLGEPGAILFRKELLTSCGNFDASFKYFFDLELLLRFLKRSNAFVWRQPLCQFRIHGASASASMRQTALDEYRRLLDKYREDLRFSERPGLRPYLQVKSRLVVFLRNLVFRIYGKSA